MPFAEEWDDILVYLASPLSRELARARLERISGSWPSDVNQLKHSVALASQGHLQELMLMHLLARVLLAGRAAPKWLKGWLTDNNAINLILSEISPRKAFSLKWDAVPVPIVKIDGQGGVFMMIMAPMKGSPGVTMPYWSRETMESDCLEAISQACSAAVNLAPAASRNTGFFCWPLLDPGGPPVKGQSLGLPLSIALSMIGQNNHWPKALMATGSIDDQGNIMPVGGLMAKSRVAAESGAQLFLYPDEEKIDFKEWPVPALPVSDLKQAMTFAQLIAIGLPAVSNFRLYYSCLQNPALLLDNFSNIPDSVLEWAKDRGILAKVKGICQSTSGFAGLVNKLGDSNLTCKHRELLATVLGEEDLAGLAVRSSQDALMVSNWYTCLAALADDVDDSEKSQQWKTKAKKIFREFGNKIFVFYRTDDHQACYQRFDKDFGRRLKAMEEGLLKSQVAKVWGKQAIYIHLPITRGDEVSVRVFLSEDDQLVALSLNAVNLDIDPEQGKAQFIEDCLHAVYLGLIRAAFVINKKRLMDDQKLHQALSRYLAALMDSVFSQEIVLDQASKERLAVVCNYYYASLFLGLEPEEAAAWRPGGKDCPDAGGLAGVIKSLIAERDNSSPLRWLSRLAFKAGLSPNGDWLWRRLATSLSREICYSLGGALDHFMGLCVLSSYPTTLFENPLPSHKDLSRQVETILMPFMNALEYAAAKDAAHDGQA
jgi:hypothetical protein